MKRTLRILLVDDHGLFSDALASVLGALAPAVTVSSAASCEAALGALEREAPFDLVLLDLGLPGLRGRAAFEALELLRAGARGYVHKRASSEELVAVLRFVLSGGTHVPQVALTATSPGAVSLTPRQREVLALLARGSSNKDIARALGISEATVRVHVSSVMRALGVENRTQAATSSLGRRLAEAD